jgi:hypothetical protein
MIGKKIIFFSLLISLYSSLFALGKKDEQEVVKVNNEWLLCVTQFDFSMIPPSQRISGEVVTRSLIKKLNDVSYRLRVSPEYAYYEGYAWQQSVNAAARALSQKQDERSQLIYRGDPEWRYRKNTARVDIEIDKLKEELAKKEAQRPVVNNEPVFGLVKANMDGVFPAPPKPGTERRFCQNQKADAFLLGSVREFHGRLYIDLKLYGIYANDYIYNDDIIFSVDDADSAVEEIAISLTSALAGNKPAVIVVKADPPETQVLINSSYAGRGTVEELEFPPGKITIAAAAEGYVPEIAEPDLVSGETTVINFNLLPLFYSDVNIDTPGFPGMSLYEGALYVGDSPLNLRIPVDSMSYITAVDKNKQVAQIVLNTPDVPDEPFSFSMLIKPPRGSRMVNKARSKYYWSWGATWLSAILAWSVSGIYTSHNDAAARSPNPDFWDTTRNLYYLNTGTLLLFTGVAAYNLYQLTRYLYTATEGAAKTVKQEKK